MFFVKSKDGAQRLTDLLVYFWSNKKSKSLTKKCDISRRKFKNIESKKMVPKRPLLEELWAILENIGFLVRFSGKKWAQKSDLLGYFWVHKNKTKLIKKWDNCPKKKKKRGTPKTVSKRLKGHYLRNYEQF